MRGSRCGAAPPLIRSHARDGRSPAQEQGGSVDMVAQTASLRILVSLALGQQSRLETQPLKIVT